MLCLIKYSVVSVGLCVGVGRTSRTKACMYVCM
jgi:hypothetical protein